MPTIVDSLIVTLGLDATKFTQGQKDSVTALRKTEVEANQSAKRMEASGKQAAMFFTQIKNQALGLATVLMGGVGIKRFAENITMSDRAVGRLSKNLEMSVTELSAWQGVAKRFGSSSEDIDNAFRSTMKLVQGIQHGEVNQETLSWLARSGVDLAKFLDAATPIDAKLKMIQQAFAQTSAAEAQFFGGMTGYSEQTVNMLRETAAQMDVHLRKQKELNSVNQKDVELANQRSQAYQDLSDRVEHNFRSFMNWATPIIKMDRAIDDWIISKMGGQGSDMSPKSGTSKPIRPYSGDAPSSTPTPTPSSGSMGQAELHKLMQKLEGSGPNSVSPKGAIGRNQIMPATAKLYGFDPARLFEPEYNDQVSKVILADLSQKYNGNVDHILANYNSSPRGTKKFMATGDASTLPQETQKYLSRAHQIMAKSGMSGGGGGGGGAQVSVGQIVIHTQATDANGIAREIGPALQTYTHVLPSNPGLN